ncbi:MAG: T9SS type A sorting domain-containing protein [Bacteroidota bacterium]
MKSYIICLGLALLIGANLNGQVSLERQVVGTAGNYSSGGNVQLSATVGEAVTETKISGSIVLTQGFQQPDRNFGQTGIEDLMELVVNYEVFPNPTSDRLNVTLESEKPVKLQLRIYDMSGRLLPSYTQRVEGTGKMESQLSIATLAEGIYLLSFLDENGEVLISHKIRKL